MLGFEVGVFFRRRIANGDVEKSGFGQVRKVGTYGLELVAARDKGPIPMLCDFEIPAVERGGFGVGRHYVL